MGGVRRTRKEIERKKAKKEYPPPSLNDKCCGWTIWQVPLWLQIVQHCFKWKMKLFTQVGAEHTASLFLFSSSILSFFFSPDILGICALAPKKQYLYTVSAPLFVFSHECTCHFFYPITCSSPLRLVSEIRNSLTFCRIQKSNKKHLKCFKFE